MTCPSDLFISNIYMKIYTPTNQIYQDLIYTRITRYSFKILNSDISYYRLFCPMMLINRNFPCLRCLINCHK